LIAQRSFGNEKPDIAYKWQLHGTLDRII